MLCNRLALIHQGRLLACGTPDEVKQLMQGTILEIRIGKARQAAAFFRQQFPAAFVGLFGDRIHLVISYGQRCRSKSARCPWRCGPAAAIGAQYFLRRWKTCLSRR